MYALEWTLRWIYEWFSPFFESRENWTCTGKCSASSEIAFRVNAFHLYFQLLRIIHEIIAFEHTLLERKKNIIHEIVRWTIVFEKIRKRFQVPFEAGLIYGIFAHFQGLCNFEGGKQNHTKEILSKLSSLSNCWVPAVFCFEIRN